VNLAPKAEPILAQVECSEGDMTQAQDTELHRAVGRIEGKLDAFISKLAEADKRHDNAGKRIAAVERKQAWYSGAAAAVGAIAAYFVKH
jgi:hypothetical protein